jgi:hypothetical protein
MDKSENAIENNCHMFYLGHRQSFRALIDTGADNNLVRNTMQNCLNRKTRGIASAIQADSSEIPIRNIEGRNTA